MATPPISKAVQDEVLDAINTAARNYPDLPFKARGGNDSVLNRASVFLGNKGLAKGTIRNRVQRTEQFRPAEFGEACIGEWAGGRPDDAAPITLTKRGVRRYLLTAAQNDTPLHTRFWENLHAFARHIGAEISVGGFTYQLGVFTDHTARNQVFAEDVRPYMSHAQVDLGGVVWCPEMNIVPTAVRPLSGLDTYTRGRYGVFPHAKIQLVSAPAIGQGGAAILSTTGACTRPNYIEKKAGLKAIFHHQIGAALVVIDENGDRFIYQIAANAEDGSFQHFTLKVADGKVSDGHRVEAITWGDIHREKIDPAVARSCWGVDVATDEHVERDSLLDHLRPRHQFYHDLLDFEARNHHRRGDHTFLFKMIQEGTDSVEDAIKASSRFLRLTARPWCQSVVIPSNHNDAYPRWLRETDCRGDPVNAKFWMESNLALYNAIERGDSEFDIFKWALSRYDDRGLEDIVFLPRNGSYLICQAHGGIENVLHGDQGPNGARGTPLNLSRVGARLNTGHTHVASILDGVYTAGLCGLFEQGYNEGPSSWSQTQIITYPNAKRTLLTMQGGRWLT